MVIQNLFNFSVEINIKMIKRAFTIIFFAVLFLASCSPKTVEKTTSPPAETIDKNTDVDKPRLTPCVTFDDLSPADKDKAETAYVLYKDMINLKNYTTAYSLWKVAYNLAPGSNGKVKSQYDDGVAIYTDLFNNTQDSILKQNYVDTINTLYAKRLECFGPDPYVEAKKAFDFYYNFQDYIDQEELFNLFASASDAKPNKADYFIVNPFARLLYDRVLDGTTDYETGSRHAVQLLNSIDHGLSTTKGEYLESWNVINDYAPPLLEALEGFDGFYDCDYYTKKYYKLYKDNNEECEYVNLAYSRMLRGGCPLANAEVVEMQELINTRCYVAPPPSSDIKLGNQAYQEGRYKDAVNHYEDYIAKTESDENKAKFQLLIAKIYYRDLKSFSKSRKYALDAAKNKSNWGEPFILIGKLYASSGPLCGPGRGWDSQIVTWPAIDKFEYAKRIDPSVSSEANKLINTYEKYMPSVEDIFSRPGINKGDSFFVGCWIQENTTIRAAK